MHFSEHSKAVQWAICTAANSEEIDRILKAQDTDGYEGIEIDFKMNGIQIDFTAFMDRLDEIMDKESTRKAYDIATSLEVNKHFAVNALYMIRHQIISAQQDIDHAIDQMVNPIHDNEEDE